MTDMYMCLYTMQSDNCCYIQIDMHANMHTDKRAHRQVLHSCNTINMYAYVHCDHSHFCPIHLNSCLWHCSAVSHGCPNATRRVIIRWHVWRSWGGCEDNCLTTIYIYIYIYTLYIYSIYVCLVIMYLYTNIYIYILHFFI